MALKGFSDKWIGNIRKFAGRFGGDNAAADNGSNMPDGSQQGYSTSRHMFSDSMRMQQVPQQPVTSQQTQQQGPAPYGNDPLSQYTGSVTGFGNNTMQNGHYDPMASQVPPPAPQFTGQQPVNQNTGYQPVHQNTSYQQPVNQNTGYQPVHQNTSYQQPVNQSTGYQPVHQNTSYQQPVNQSTSYQPVHQNTSYQQPVNQSTSYQPVHQNTSYQQPQQQQQPQQPNQHRKRKGQSGNVVQLNPESCVTAPDGTSYSHVERVVQLMSVSRCFSVIEFMRADESVIVNTEGIASEMDIQRCLDMLAGAAFTLQATLTKISQQKHVYLIAPRKVMVLADRGFDAWNDSSEARQQREIPRRDPYRQAPNSYHQSQQRASGQASAIYGSDFDRRY